MVWGVVKGDFYSGHTKLNHVYKARVVAKDSHNLYRLLAIVHYIQISQNLAKIKKFQLI
jgi:hypothetical protein